MSCISMTKGEFMNKYDNRFFQKLISRGCMPEDIVTEEKINKDTYFALVGQLPKGVPMCGASIWVWSNDINKLASFIYQCEIRNNFALNANLQENDFEQDLTDYILYTQNCFDIEQRERLTKYYDWINRFDKEIKSAISFGNLKNLIDDYNKLNIPDFDWEMDIRLFANLDEAIEEYNSLVVLTENKINAEMSVEDLAQAFLNVFY